MSEHMISLTREELLDWSDTETSDDILAAVRYQGVNAEMQDLIRFVHKYVMRPHLQTDELDHEMLNLYAVCMIHDGLSLSNYSYSKMIAESDPLTTTAEQRHKAKEDCKIIAAYYQTDDGKDAARMSLDILSMMRHRGSVSQESVDKLAAYYFNYLEVIDQNPPGEWDNKTFVERVDYFNMITQNLDDISVQKGERFVHVGQHYRVTGNAYANTGYHEKGKGITLNQVTIENFSDTGEDFEADGYFEFIRNTCGHELIHDHTDVMMDKQDMPQADRDYLTVWNELNRVINPLKYPLINAWNLVEGLDFKDYAEAIFEETPHEALVTKAIAAGEVLYAQRKGPKPA